MNLEHKKLAEKLQYRMLAVKMGQKVGVIVERDLHQARSQKLVSFNVELEE